MRWQELSQIDWNSRAWKAEEPLAVDSPRASSLLAVRSMNVIDSADSAPLVRDTRWQIFDQPISVDDKLAGIGLAETVRGQAQFRLVCRRGARERKDPCAGDGRSKRSQFFGFGRRRRRRRKASGSSR